MTARALIRRFALHVAAIGYPAAAAAAARLPAAAVEPLARVLGYVAAVLLPGRRRMIQRHLRRASSDTLRGPALRRAAAASLQSYARYWIETFRLERESPASLDARFDVDGIGHLAAAVAEGRGAVVVAPHLGGWDAAGAWLARRGYAVTTVAEHIEPPRLYDWFVARRAELGIETIPHGSDTLRALGAALARGGVVALLCDSDLGRRGVGVDFFGERTTLPAGPAKLALQSGAPLLAAAVYQLPGGRLRGVVCPPIPVTPTGRLRDDVSHVT